MPIKINLLWIIIAPFLLLSNCYGSTPLQVSGNMGVTTIDHSKWEILLKKHVDHNGNVDYVGFKQDKSLLENYLNHLAQNPISDTAPKAERLAYYINLYNAGTVLLILENYPLKSIKDIFRPWGKDRINIGSKKYSLGEIEHEILRKMDEPRIHFAINCASFSCPKLFNTAFTAKKMEEQLENATFEFVNDPSKNKIRSKSVKLSKIFSWYKGDFTEQGSLIDYINRYSKIKVPKKARVDYLDYDWSLNEE